MLCVRVCDAEECFFAKMVCGEEHADGQVVAGPDRDIHVGESCEVGADGEHVDHVILEEAEFFDLREGWG